MEKYRKNFELEEDDNGAADEEHKETIMVFHEFLKKQLSAIEGHKAMLKKMGKTRDKENQLFLSVMTKLQ